MPIVGTSGFFYYDWKGVFYPFGISPSGWLEFYASKFNGLEINSSFYRLPSASTVKTYKKFSDRLTFVFKLYRGITHYRKLEEESREVFFRAKEILGDSFCCLLAQFPPSFKPSDRNREFLLEVRKVFSEIGVVFELRASQWRDYEDWLKEEGLVVCKIDFPPAKGWWSGGIFTEELAYFRFHGRRRLYRDSYTEEELNSFAEEISNVKSDSILCFFNNTAGGLGALNALKLKELLEKCCNSEEESRN